MLFPPLPQARLADVYAAADVVLVPSRSESFGLVALEAQACGTPVVAAAVGRPAVRRRGRADRVPGGGARSRPTTPTRMLQILRDPALAGASRGRGGARGAALHVGRHRERARGIYRELAAAGSMIQGDHVTLRPVEERDYPLIHAWQNDPEVWWLMDYETPFSLADIAASERRARPRRGSRSSSRPRDARSAASGSTTSVAATGSARSTSSSAIARRGGRVSGPTRSTRMLAHAFARFDLRQVELWSLADNERALRAYAPLRVPRGGAARRALVEGRPMGRSRPHVGHARELRRGRAPPVTSANADVHPPVRRFVTLCLEP